MATIDVLRYILDLDTKKFVAESRRAESATQKLTNTIGTKLKTAITGAIAAYAGWRGLNVAGDMMNIAAQAERIAYSFDNIADSLGLSGKKILTELRNVSKGTISDIQLMTQASRAAIMELPMKDLPELMQISRAAAKAFGQDASYMFESIVLGIARQSRLILDNLGIIVNQEMIYRRETERLGRELTEAEKKQAFFNEVLKQGQSIIAAVGEDTQDYADALAQFNAAWENFKVGMGKKLLETGVLDVFKAVVGFITGTYVPTMNRIWTEQDKKMQEHRREWEKTLKEGLIFHITVVADKIREINWRLEETAKLLRVNVGGWSQWAMLTKGIREAFPVGTGTLITTPAPFGTGPVAAELEPFFTRLWFEVKENIGDGTDILQGAFDQLIYSIEGTAGDILRIAQSAITSDFYSVGVNTIAFIMNAVSDSAERANQRFNEQIAAYERLNTEIQRNINLISQMTIAEREARIEQLEYWRDLAQQLIDSGQAWAIAMTGPFAGMTARDIIEAATAELDELYSVIAQFAELRSVQTYQELLNFLTGTGGQLTYQQGRTIIDYFIEMLDLNTEQQLELWELFRDILGGNLTEVEWMQLNETIKNLQEEGIPLIAESPDIEPSQTLRSVTTVTETQANLLVGILNTINLEIRKLVARADSVLEIMRGWGRPMGAGGGNILYITMNVSGSSGREIAREFTNELRSSGMKLA